MFFIIRSTENGNFEGEGDVDSFNIVWYRTRDRDHNIIFRDVEQNNRCKSFRRSIVVGQSTAIIFYCSIIIYIGSELKKKNKKIIIVFYEIRAVQTPLVLQQGQKYYRSCKGYLYFIFTVPVVRKKEKKNEQKGIIHNTYYIIFEYFKEYIFFFLRLAY